MANRIEEVINNLYTLVQEAWGVPLGADKCVVERDKVLDMLDAISAQLPGELKESRIVIDTRNEIVGNAKREAENIIREAEEKAAALVQESEIYKAAQVEARRLIKECQEKNMELRRVTNEFVDNALQSTEASIEQALNEVKTSRSKFAAITGSQVKTGSPIIEDI